jgi:hypothetical protein
MTDPIRRTLGQDLANARSPGTHFVHKKTDMYKDAPRLSCYDIEHLLKTRFCLGIRIRLDR